MGAVHTHRLYTAEWKFMFVEGKRNKLLHIAT